MLALNGVNYFNFSYDFNASAEKEVGRHEAAIRCVEFCPQLGMIVDLCCLVHNDFKLNMFGGN